MTSSSSQRHQVREEPSSEKQKASSNPFVARFFQARAEGTLPLKWGEALQGHKGQWQQQFSLTQQEQPKKLFVEIGSYKGKTSIEWASHYPDCGFIGMDITYKRIVLSAERSQELRLCNILWLLADASRLEAIFQENELDGIAVFFPDPWQKKKNQLKKQLLNESFCTQLATVLKPGGFFWFKTDSEKYWLKTLNLLEDSLLLQELPLRTIPLSPTEPTIFESLFKRQGLPIFQGIWYNSKNLSESTSVIGT